MSIELVLFDFGGVIAPEGFQLGVLKLSLEFNRSYQDMYQLAGHISAFQSGYTAGKIDERKYWDKLAELLETEEDLYHYRYIFLDNFVLRSEMISLMKQTAIKCKIGIFSDHTNWLHEINDKNPFMDICDYKFISYDLGYTKYDEYFYDIPSEVSKIDNTNILVIDDKERVLDNCRKKGMHTHLFTSIENCIEFFKANNIC